MCTKIYWQDPLLMTHIHSNRQSNLEGENTKTKAEKGREKKRREENAERKRKNSLTASE